MESLNALQTSQCFYRIVQSNYSPLLPTYKDQISMHELASEPQSTKFSWPWISAVIGSILFLICLTGLAVLLTGNRLLAKNNSRIAPDTSNPMPAHWGSYLAQHGAQSDLQLNQQQLQQNKDTMEHSGLTISGHEKSRAGRTILMLERQNPDKILVPNEPTLGNYADKDSRDSDLESEDTTSYMAQPLIEPLSDHGSMADAITVPPGDLDPYYRDLNHAILRYFKSVLQRMTDHSERTRRAKALEFLVQYSGHMTNEPKYRFPRADNQVSLASILRRSVLIDIFNELDYNGKLHGLIPEIMIG
ncbi:unnamed protein product [Echinostoma caproni]|uniref:Uncharacterized protein n=1 Tax=Echinostoma caproni TaxID=27848 RepID=A0A183AYY9_9TREM|nr:unnamed protein product [Echinostoma caproni]